MTDKPYYEKHLFFCARERSGGDSCLSKKTKKAQEYAADLIRELGLKGKGKVRINQTGCLGRCEEGPVLVVYPEGVWYSYKNQQDVEEIIRSHIVGGQVVERLKI